ncbi:MAG: hypothetical protein OEY59_07320 [Deltaproteobacteria bacterium]|nr:hypothetical protein [Deltaproteobacteria bacterium]
MKQEIKQEIAESLKKATNWTQEGWKTTFGPKNIEVNSLKQAQDLPKQFAYKLEAVDYWKTVGIIAKEVTLWLEKALVSFDKGDFKAVEDQVYFAKYVEKPYERVANTCKPLLDKIRQAK